MEFIATPLLRPHAQDPVCAAAVARLEIQVAISSFHYIADASVLSAIERLLSDDRPACWRFEFDPVYVVREGVI
jgi:hypothetical protein